MSRPNASTLPTIPRLPLQPLLPSSEPDAGGTSAPGSHGAAPASTAPSQTLPAMTPRTAPPADLPPPLPNDAAPASAPSSGSSPLSAVPSGLLPQASAPSLPATPPTWTRARAHSRAPSSTSAIPTSHSTSSSSFAPAPPTQILAPSTSGKTPDSQGDARVRLPSSALPDPKVICDPKALARLLVLAASENYTKPLAGDSVNRILRDKATVLAVHRDGTQPHETEINVIDTYLAPFMNHYFGTREVENILYAVEQSYEASQGKIAAAYASFGDGKAFCRDQATHATMKPIIAPLLQFICGEKVSVDSCGLPAPVLALMLEVDRCVSKWYDECGLGQSEEKRKARRNALTSFMGTRSFMVNWTVRLTTDTSRPNGFYRPLVAYVNSYLNLQIEEFAGSMIDCDDATRALVGKKAKIYASRSVAEKGVKEKAHTSLKEKLKEAEQEKPTGKPGLLGRISVLSKGKRAEGSSNSAEEPLSPRGKRETEVAYSPHNQLRRGDTLKVNDNRQTTARKNRSKVSKEVIQFYRLNQSKLFMQHFHSKVHELDRQAYRDFKQNPLDYCRSLLDAYITQFVGSGKGTTEENDALYALAASLKAAPKTSFEFNSRKEDGENG